MAKSPPYLHQLRSELLDLVDDAMLLEELDGFIAGVVCCPELIQPGEWLPVVWGRTDEDSAPVFESIEHANKVVALVMGHYNHVAVNLSKTPDRYSPLFAEDDRNGDILWEIWIEGFDKAMKLRPTAWLPLLEADTEISDAVRGLLTLTEVARREDQVSKIRREELQEIAHELIGPWVAAINEWRMENFSHETGTSAAFPATHTPFGKVGRNDPCPCGSGKKYKKCCGLN
ncbi:hypothetical protein AMST5_03372 [freshwater sediment metagenome]|uniref:YecA family protein n=1 Tax=freshwater sediment metagenome TaxID=556182 RepID=A0AA48M4G9_9ZZZZ